jgi:sugar/nucleoside kinase (ribokinase family)
MITRHLSSDRLPSANATARFRYLPAPILTVTIEQQTVGPELHVHPGGQGVWQARMIAALGTPVVLCAALGGETGDVLGRLLAAEQGVRVRTVRRRTGTGWYVHDRRDGGRAVVPSIPATRWSGTTSTSSTPSPSPRACASQWAC